MVSITLLDLVILVFLFAVVIVSARRGFAVTSCGLVGNLIALLVAIVSAGMGTPVLSSAIKGSVGLSVQEQLGLALPESAAGFSGDVAGTVLEALKASVLRPMVFAVAFLFVLSLWHYGCLYFGLMDRFPHAKKFDQLSGAGLGLLKAVVLTAAVVYVLASLGMISREQLRSSLLLGKLWSLWRGAGG